MQSKVASKSRRTHLTGIAKTAVPLNKNQCIVKYKLNLESRHSIDVLSLKIAIGLYSIPEFITF